MFWRVKLGFFSYTAFSGILQTSEIAVNSTDNPGVGISIYNKFSYYRNVYLYFPWLTEQGSKPWMN